MGGLGQGSYLSNLWGALQGKPPRVSPFKEAGVSGTAIFGGFVQNIERDSRLHGQERYRTAADLLANVSIIAAGLRFFLNLTAVPNWNVQPAEDLGKGKSSGAAVKAADFFASVLDDMATSRTRIARRSGLFRFHGFGIQEWTAKRRDDGMIGVLDIESRPQHTIEKWAVNNDGSILGVQQRSPQTGELLWLPRGKYVYLVDDMLSDSPEGLGLFRHLVEPGERLKTYLKLEGQGYERDLRGIPIGRAPLAEINNAVKAGQLKKEDGEKMIGAIRSFVRNQVRSKDTGLLLDSASYTGPTADGFTVSQLPKWAVELLTGSSTGFADLGTAINRLTEDMARILGVEILLVGSGGSGSGARSLSEDKSKNLYLNVNGTVGDIVEAIERDVRDPIWALNGLPDELKPRIKPEDVAFKDVAVIAKALSDMATAGAVLQPDDPAINDLRDLMGVSQAPEPDPEMLGLVAAANRPPPDPNPTVPPPKGEPK
jgi:hypothetical protein